jgi:hypothetical protein
LIPRIALGARKTIDISLFPFFVFVCVGVGLEAEKEDDSLMLSTGFEFFFVKREVYLLFWDTVNLRKTNTPIAALIARGVSFFRDPNECKIKEIQKLHGAKNTKGVAFSGGSGLQVFTVHKKVCVLC